jgi:hypothetical protein
MIAILYGGHFGSKPRRVPAAGRLLALLFPPSRPRSPVGLPWVGVVGGWRDPKFRAPRSIFFLYLHFYCPQGGRSRLGAGCRPCLPWVAGAGARRVCGRWARRFSSWRRGAASSLGVRLVPRACWAGRLRRVARWWGGAGRRFPLLPVGRSCRDAGAWVALGACLPCCPWVAAGLRLFACVCGRCWRWAPGPLVLLWALSCRAAGGVGGAGRLVALPGGVVLGRFAGGAGVGWGSQCPLPSRPLLLSVASGPPAVL